MGGQLPPPPQQPSLAMNVALLVLAVSTNATTAPREPCIVIADVGGDDGLALLLALASTELEILGVASSFGSHFDVRQTSANAKTLMAAAHHDDVPVYVGSRVPYGGSTRDPVPDGSFIHGADGFGGLGGSVSDCDAISAAQPSASEWMVSTIRAAPGQVTILCFSPLTNLALALALEPSLPRLVRRVILMGGALAHAGNASPLAEANFAHDAAAAKAVLDAWAAHAAPDVHQLVLLPLDVTHQALLSLELQAGLRSRGGPAAQLAARAFAVYQDGYCRYGQMCDGAPVHDAMVVAFATHPHLFHTCSTLVPHLTNASTLVPASGDETSSSSRGRDGCPGSRARHVLCRSSPSAARLRHQRERRDERRGACLCGAPRRAGGVRGAVCLRGGTAGGNSRLCPSVAGRGHQARRTRRRIRNWLGGIRRAASHVYALHHLGIILRRIRRFTLQDQRTFDLSVVILSTMIFPCTNYSSNYA